MDYADSKKTPLYEAHKRLNAKVVDFHGWFLPIQYTSIIEEHNATRTKAGLFDVSHLGKVEINGAGAFDFLQEIFTNDIAKSDSNKVVYSPFCDKKGGVLDDVFIYRLAQDRFILIVNAATFDKDLAWFRANLPLAHPEEGKGEGITIKDINDSLGGIAIQGPSSLNILSAICDTDLNKMSRRGFCRTKVNGVDCLLSRSGYTGEDGFEMFPAADKTETVWNGLLERGKEFGLLPAGLGARDTLRLEAGCPLYGVDVDETKSPLEARLEWAVDFKKDFIGKPALLKRKGEGIKEVLVGFKMLDKAIARTGYPMKAAGRDIGVVTSGTYSPTLKESIGFGYVLPEYSPIGTNLDIVIHNGAKRAQIAQVPFYRRNK